MEMNADVVFWLHDSHLKRKGKIADGRMIWVVVLQA